MNLAMPTIPPRPTDVSRPFMMSNIVGENAMQARIGAAVEVEFQDVGEVALPRYRLVAK